MRGAKKATARSSNAPGVDFPQCFHFTLDKRDRSSFFAFRRRFLHQPPRPRRTPKRPTALQIPGPSPSRSASNCASTRIIARPTAATTCGTTEFPRAFSCSRRRRLADRASRRENREAEIPRLGSSCPCSSSPVAAPRDCPRSPVPPVALTSRGASHPCWGSPGRAGQRLRKAAGRSVRALPGSLACSCGRAKLASATSPSSSPEPAYSNLRGKSPFGFHGLRSPASVARSLPAFHWPAAKPAWPTIQTRFRLCGAPTSSAPTTSGQAAYPSPSRPSRTTSAPRVRRAGTFSASTQRGRTSSMIRSISNQRPDREPSRPAPLPAHEMS